MLAVRYSHQAGKTLKRMQPKRAGAIVAAIHKLAEAPARRDLDVERLTGRPGFRLRVGRWRVIFELEKDMLDVLWIGPRGQAYKG